MYATSCDIPSGLRSLGDIEMLVVLLLKTAHTHCISSFLPCICTSLNVFAESGVSVPYWSWLNIPALGFSRMTLDFWEIQWGWTSSWVTICACAPKFSIPSSVSSNLPHRARYWQTYTDSLLADCRRNVGAWFVDCCLCHLGLCFCLCHLQGRDNHGSSAWSISSIGRCYDGRQCHIGISRWLSVVCRPPWVAMVMEVDLLVRWLMTCPTCRGWMDSYMLLSSVRLMVGFYTLCCPNEMTCQVASEVLCLVHFQCNSGVWPGAG